MIALARELNERTPEAGVRLELEDEMESEQNTTPGAQPEPVQPPTAPTPPAAAPQVVAPVPAPYGAAGAVPEPAAPKKKMSTGAKWALWLGIGFVLLVLGSCALSVYLIAAPSDASLDFAGGESVALIHIDGVIAGTGTVYEGYITPEYLLDQLDQALADPDVAAIVLRIDSPGGTVAASWEIAEAVRRAAEEKPVVASIGDVGASGAYMVAAQCDRIVASPGSAVGSIGVIMEVPNIEGLLDKLGVEFTTITTGEFKDSGSPYRSLTETETARYREQMAGAYDQFIADVAEGRDMTEAEVRELATGWVWLGAEAMDLGLIDELGTFDDGIEAAAELGGIGPDPYITTYETVDPFESLLFDMIGILAPGRGLDAESIQRSALPR